MEDYKEYLLDNYLDECSMDEATLSKYGSKDNSFIDFTTSNSNVITLNFDDCIF